MNHTSFFHSDLLEGNYYPQINAYYFKYWENYQMDYHAHKEVEIMYVIDGECVVETLKDSFSLKKNEFIFLDSNVPHRLIVDKGNQCRMLNIEFTFISKESSLPSIKELSDKNIAFSQFLTLQYPYFVLKDPNEIYHTLKNLVLESDKKEDNDIMVQLLLSQLFIQIARLTNDNQKSQNQDQQVNIYVGQAIEYIHQNYDIDIKLSDIGRAVSLHPGYLHRIFKQVMNRTIIEYLTHLRIEKAKMLLADTDIPIIDISQYVGMNSSQYFSQVFKKHTKQTPIEFRKNHESQIVKFNGS